MAVGYDGSGQPSRSRFTVLDPPTSPASSSSSSPPPTPPSYEHPSHPADALPPPPPAQMTRTFQPAAALPEPSAYSDDPPTRSSPQKSQPTPLSSLSSASASSSSPPSLFSDSRSVSQLLSSASLALLRLDLDTQGSLQTAQLIRNQLVNRLFRPLDSTSRHPTSEHQELRLSSLAHLPPHQLNSLRDIICSSASSNTLLSFPAFTELCRYPDPQTPLAPASPLFRDQSQHLPRSLRKRSLPVHPAKTFLRSRQYHQGNGSGPTADGYPTCTAVSNAILSCFPTSNTTLVQNTWSKFIWNNNYPTFIGSQFVDIYLFNAQSETAVANWTSIANDRGMIGVYAADSWFPSTTTWVDGRNVSYPYFFVIVSSGATLTGGEQHQSTFTVVQTAAPVTLAIASLSSASVRAHSLPSFSPASTGLPNSSLQSASGGDSFPKWEIALIVILGSFALLAFLVAAYLAFNNARRRRQIRIWQQAGVGGSGAGSVGSRSPMIQNAEATALMSNPKGAAISPRGELNSPGSSRPGSPLSANLTTAAATFGLRQHVGLGDSLGDAARSTDGPITSVDATIMADAFRKALRKPEFEGVEPDSAGSLEQDADEKHPSLDASDKPMTPTQRIRQSMHAQVISMVDLGDHEEGEEEDEAKEIMDRELASEGRSMTSVDNRRRPEVQHS